ncbi:hypothetical protein [Rhizobium sp. GCM10022189]|uniref:hypothetical protein n=1 Tax=Rhizobium sp. GCM10022189 TaxID=3252654 RepID=UPI003613FD68
MKRKRTGEAKWVWRRVIIFPVVGWACYEIDALITAADTRVNETIAYGLMMLIAILILGYTGFATAQDVAAIWRTGRANPYRDDLRDDADERLPVGAGYDPTTGREVQ